MSSTVMERIESAARAVRSRISGEFPRIAVVLGSGLGSVLDEMEVRHEVPYVEIPGFGVSTVAGHEGKLVFGELAGVPIVAMRGRLHHYEGYAMSDVVLPYRMLGMLGAETFLVTNASGGVHADMAPRDLVLIKDHINMTGSNPLIGPNLEALGPRFPDMTEAYHAGLRRTVRTIAETNGIRLREGIYLGITGPSYETPAEIKMYRMLGADVVGMSTVPEVIALNHMGKRVVAISCVTNLAAGVGDRPLNHEEVLSAAKGGFQELALLIKESLRAFEAER